MPCKRWPRLCVWCKGPKFSSTIHCSNYLWKDYFFKPILTISRNFCFHPIWKSIFPETQICTRTVIFFSQLLKLEFEDCWVSTLQSEKDFLRYTILIKGLDFNFLDCSNYNFLGERVPRIGRFGKWDEKIKKSLLSSFLRTIWKIKYGILKDIASKKIYLYFFTRIFSYTPSSLGSTLANVVKFRPY